MIQYRMPDTKLQLLKGFEGFKTLISEWLKLWCVFCVRKGATITKTKVATRIWGKYFRINVLVEAEVIPKSGWRGQQWT